MVASGVAIHGIAYCGAARTRHVDARDPAAARRRPGRGSGRPRRRRAAPLPPRPGSSPGVRRAAARRRATPRPPPGPRPRRRRPSSSSSHLTPMTGRTRRHRIAERYPAWARATPYVGRMRFQVIPVPGCRRRGRRGRRAGADEGAVFTGTADGSIFRVSHDGRKLDKVAHTGGRPLGIEIDLDGRLVVCDARPRGAAGRHRHGCGRAGDRLGRRPADGVLQQRRRRLRRHGVVLRLVHEVRRRPLEGRRRPGHVHGPAAAARHGRPGRRRARRPRVRQRGGARGRRVVRRRRGVRRPRPSSATGSPATEAGQRDRWSTTCPAIPTTSPGGATG